MSKNNQTSDFVREAIREKALRELVSLEQRTDAMGAVDRARDALFTASADLGRAAGAIFAVSTDPATATRLKKLRKLIDDGHALATELGDALGSDSQRAALETSRKSILEAVQAAGIDPATLTAESPAQS